MLIKKISLKDIKPYANNPRINDEAVAGVLKSIENYDYIEPIVLDRDYNILAGHTRYKALLKLGKYQEIECVVAEHLTAQKAKEYRLVDNKVAEKSFWDDDLLKQELEELEEMGSDIIIDFDSDLAEFVEDSEGGGKVVDNDEFDIDVETNEHGVKRGDIWQLGNHRLMCGDSSDASDVSKLANGQKMDMIFTDPPYNVSIGDKNKSLQEFGKYGRITKNIEGDSGMSDEEVGRTLWYPAFKNLYDNANDNCSIYVTMPQGKTHMMMMMMAKSGWQVKHELIWLKDCPTFSMGRLDYDYQHEPICFGWKKTHKKIGKGAFTKSVWNIPKPKKSDLHPTMKPIELMVNAMENSSEPGDKVMDLFGGSGSTLIACEKIGRICFMMEYDPHYVDVIISRWEKLTGQTAERILSGEIQ